MTTADDVLARLRAPADPTRPAGMARHGIATESAYGVTVTELRAVAKDLGPDHDLAATPWDTGVHEAPIPASLVTTTRSSAERPTSPPGSWGDRVCQNLFRHGPPAWRQAVECTCRRQPFVRRAGFTLIAGLAVADETADDERFARRRWDGPAAAAVRWPRRPAGRHGGPARAAERGGPRAAPSRQR